MTNQPGASGTSGNPGVPAAAAATAASAWQDDEPQTDEGVPVGQADVEADRERASGDTDDETEDDADGPDLMDPLDEQRSTDDGVPVGSADAEEDRRRASDDDA